MTDAMVQFILKMKHSPLSNYIIPGLTSWLIGQPDANNGCVRLFTMSRDHTESIQPHSHRFDFRCLVLQGHVQNHLWTVAGNEGDIYEATNTVYGGEPGKFTASTKRRARYVRDTKSYKAGEEYAMKAEEIHSITFSRGASVLFFEGPRKTDISTVLEPVVDGETIPLFRTEPWMYGKVTK